MLMTTLWHWGYSAFFMFRISIMAPLLDYVKKADFLLETGDCIIVTYFRN
jgi:hypothetical protein